MGATKHFGLLFISDEKKRGSGVFRIYMKNWSSHDYLSLPNNLSDPVRLALCHKGSSSQAGLRTR